MTAKRKATLKIMRRFSVFLLLLLAILLHESHATIIQHKRLQHDLLSNYGGRHLRPVKDHNSSVHVYFRAKPFHFVDFEEERQLLTFTSRIQIKWTDELLTWNPDEYGGVDKLSFSKHQIWFPDITAYERIGTEPTTTNINEPLIVVNHLGQAEYYEILQLTVFCKMNVRLFPFDSHRCTQKYTSYSHDGKDLEPISWDKLMLRLHPKIDASSTENVLVRNGVWFLKNYNVKEIVEYYLCCPNPYVEIHATLFIQRESSFYVVNIGIPTLFLSLITLSVFFLHPESGERISLSVSNVLALVIFQQLLSAAMPPTGDHTPIIAYFFAVMISISFASVISTTLTLRLYFNEGTKPLPNVVRRLLEGRSTSLRPASKSYPASSSKGADHSVKQNRGKADMEDRVYPLEIDADVFGARPLELAVVDTSLTMKPMSLRRSFSQRQKSFETTNTPQNVERRSFADEWKRAAILLDRVMLILLLTGMLVTVLSCSLVFMTELGSSQEETK